MVFYKCTIYFDMLNHRVNLRRAAPHSASWYYLRDIAVIARHTTTVVRLGKRVNDGMHVSQVAYQGNFLCGQAVTSNRLVNFRNTRNGTCYTSTECSDKGGSASGNCAAGYAYIIKCLISDFNAHVSPSQFWRVLSVHIFHFRHVDFPELFLYQKSELPQRVLFNQHFDLHNWKVRNRQV